MIRSHPMNTHLQVGAFPSEARPTVSTLFPYGEDFAREINARADRRRRHAVACRFLIILIYAAAWLSAGIGIGAVFFSRNPHPL